MKCKSIFAFGFFAAVVLFLCVCPASGVTEFYDGQAKFTLDGGGFQMLNGGIPAGIWSPKSFIMDYAEGSTPGAFEYMETRFWSIGDGDVSNGGYRGRFNFYIMDGTNIPLQPHEIPVFTIDNFGRAACGNMGNGTPNPPSDFAIFQGDNTFNNGLWIIKSEYSRQGLNTACQKNYARQFCIDDSNTLHIRWAATGSDISIDEDSNVEVGGSLGIQAYPQKNLHVGAGTDTPIENAEGITVQNEGAAGVSIRDAANNVELFLHADNRQVCLGTNTNHSLSIRTNDVDRMKFDTSGNVSVEGNSMIIKNNKTPSNSLDTGTKGQICWDANYLYICVNTNTWKRVKLSDFQTNAQPDVPEDVQPDVPEDVQPDVPANDQPDVQNKIRQYPPWIRKRR